MSYSKYGNSSYQVFHKNASFRNTNDFNRDWRTNRNASRRNLNTPASRNNRQLIAFISLFIFILIFAIVIVVLFSNSSDSPGGEEVECPPDFIEQDCQSSKFIGSFVWSASKVYKLGDGLYYNNGIAFRVYAPGAESVNVLTKMPGEEERVSKMIKQENGFWFSNIGGISYGCEFAYQMNGNGKSAIHLIQNGKYAEERENAEWRNVEIHTVQNTVNKERKRSNLRSFSAGSVIYTVHLSSFTNGGNYSSFLQYLPYLKELGVTTIRLLPIDIHSCDSDKTINPHCWYRPNVVYFGLPHPHYGLQADLSSMIHTIHQHDLSIVLDLDLSKFTSYSDWYDYDTTATPTSFGSLFDRSTNLYQYDSKMCSKPELKANTPTRSIIVSTLQRYTREFGFDGFYWKGLLCLRLDSSECESGKGGDNGDAIIFLKSLYNEGWIMYGEDHMGIITVENKESTIKEIIDSTSKGGLNFDGQLDLSTGDELTTILFSEIIQQSTVVNYINSFMNKNDRKIITLATPESTFEKGRLSTQSQKIGREKIQSIHRLLLLNVLFTLTPGTLQFFMGDEFFTETPFAMAPAVLDMENAVHVGGSHYGVSLFTKQLLAFRSTHKLYLPYQPDVYYKDMENNVIAFLLKTSNKQTVAIMNLNDSLIQQVEVDLPNVVGLHYEWRYSINTDDSEIFEGISSYNHTIVLGACSQRHFYDICANFTMGPFAVKILEIKPKQI